MVPDGGERGVACIIMVDEQTDRQTDRGGRERERGETYLYWRHIVRVSTGRYL